MATVTVGVTPSVTASSYSRSTPYALLFDPWTNSFHAKDFTQKALADAVEMSLIQISRYASGTSQPTLEAIRPLAIALGVNANELVFG